MEAGTGLASAQDTAQPIAWQWAGECDGLSMVRALIRHFQGVITLPQHRGTDHSVSSCCALHPELLREPTAPPGLQSLSQSYSTTYGGLG